MLNEVVQVHLKMAAKVEINLLQTGLYVCIQKETQFYSALSHHQAIPESNRQINAQHPQSQTHCKLVQSQLPLCLIALHVARQCH